MCESLAAPKALPRLHPARLPVILLDLLNLGHLIRQECYQGNAAAFEDDSPEYLRLRSWVEGYGERFDRALESARFVMLKELPLSLTQGCEVKPESPDPKAWILGHVVGNLRANWRQIAPVLWLEIVLWLAGFSPLADPASRPSVLRLATTTRASLLAGYRKARERAGDSSLESASSSVRKHIERALGYGNLMNRIGEKIFLLAPSFCARVWSLPEPARERFGEALKELKTPPSRAVLRTMCQAAVQEPESPAPVESTPEDELETLIVKARKLIKSAGLELLLLVLPAPLPADPYKVRTIDQRSCVNCTVRGVDATFRLLARAVESFRRSGTHLSSKLRALIQSTLPEGP